MHKNLFGQQDTVPQYPNMVKDPLDYIIDILNLNDIEPEDTMRMVQELDKIDNFWSHLFPNSNAEIYDDLSEYEKKCFDDVTSGKLHVHEIENYIDYDFRSLYFLVDCPYLLCNKEEYDILKKWAMDIQDVMEELEYSIEKYKEVRSKVDKYS